MATENIDSKRFCESVGLADDEELCNILNVQRDHLSGGEYRFLIQFLTGVYLSLGKDKQDAKVLGNLLLAAVEVFLEDLLPIVRGKKEGK